MGDDPSGQNIVALYSYSLVSQIWQIYTSEVKMKKIYIFKHYPHLAPPPFLWPWDICLALSLQPPLWKNSWIRLFCWLPL